MIAWPILAITTTKMKKNKKTTAESNLNGGVEEGDSWEREGTST